MKKIYYKFMKSSFFDIPLIGILGFLLDAVGDILIIATGSLIGFIMCIGIFGVSFLLGMKISLYVGRNIDDKTNNSKIKDKKIDYENYTV